MFTKEQIETLEKNYLEEIIFLLEHEKDKMLQGLDTKEAIRGDWEKFWGDNTSDYAVGAERIYYWLFNQFGVPNSAPVGSDLFFERKDAYVHIDIKSVTLKNIGDTIGTICVGDNHNSYVGDIVTKGNVSRPYQGQLPFVYSKHLGNKIIEKPCLTYFIVLLHDTDLHELNLMYVCSMPNGCLYDTYGDDVLSAGKNPGKIRYRFKNASKFLNLQGEPSRFFVLHWNDNMATSTKKKLEFFEKIYQEQQ